MFSPELTDTNKGRMQCVEYLLCDFSKMLKDSAQTNNPIQSHTVTNIPCFC